MKSCGNPLLGDTIILYSEFTPMVCQNNNNKSLKLITMTTCCIFDQVFSKCVFVSISNVSNIYLENTLSLYSVLYSHLRCLMSIAVCLRDQNNLKTCLLCRDNEPRGGILWRDAHNATSGLRMVVPPPVTVGASRSQLVDGCQFVY